MAGWGMSEAIRNADFETIRDILYRKSSHEDDCWLWTSCLNPQGYAQTTYIPVPGGKGNIMLVHRLGASVALGRLLSKGESAHHLCAVRRCINPDHLVPATRAENTSEMLARSSYEARIAALEDALYEYAPEHPLLGA